tara:strand:- start:616 stop:912 length:297 start_codon:yes stop_codon:yes gene_type:complete
VNKIKEKKLNSIKLQIDEISHFAKSTMDMESKKTSTDDFITLKKDKDDTITLTNIIGSDLKNKISPDNFNNIKNELVEIQKVLNNHKIILDSILAKLS